MNYYAVRSDGRLIWRDTERWEDGAGMVLEPIRGVYMPCKPHGRTGGIDFYQTPDGGLAHFSSEAGAWEYIEARRAAEEIAEASPWRIMDRITVHLGEGSEE